MFQVYTFDKKGNTGHRLGRKHDTLDAARAYADLIASQGRDPRLEVHTYDRASGAFVSVYTWERQ